MPKNIDFLGCDPEQTAAILERLATDLRKLGLGQHPAPALLREAPLLRGWSFEQRPRPCLTGYMFNHPLIAEGRTGVTSEIYAIDPGRRWVRTLSRFYELGPATLHGLVD